MKKLMINGVFTVADDCSEREALLRLAIRLKQMSQEGKPDSIDWQGEIRLESV